MIGPGDPCPPATQPSRWMVEGLLCQLPPSHYSPGLFRKLLDSGSLCVENKDGQKAGNAPWDSSLPEPGGGHRSRFIWSSPPCSELTFSMEHKTPKHWTDPEKNPHGGEHEGYCVLVGSRAEGLRSQLQGHTPAPHQPQITSFSSPPPAAASQSPGHGSLTLPGALSLSHSTTVQTPKTKQAAEERLDCHCLPRGLHSNGI